MPSYLTDGTKRKSHSKISKAAVGPTCPAMRKSKAAVLRPGQIIGSTLGSIRAVSIKAAALSYRKQSIQCSNGTKIQEYDMLICRTWTAKKMSSDSSMAALGSREAGPCKNC